MITLHIVLVLSQAYLLSAIVPSTVRPSIPTTTTPRVDYIPAQNETSKWEQPLLRQEEAAGIGPLGVAKIITTVFKGLSSGGLAAINVISNLTKPLGTVVQRQQSLLPNLNLFGQSQQAAPAQQQNVIYIPAPQQQVAYPYPSYPYPQQQQQVVQQQQVPAAANYYPSTNNAQYHQQQQQYQQYPQQQQQQQQYPQQQQYQQPQAQQAPVVQSDSDPIIANLDQKYVEYLQQIQAYEQQQTKLISSGVTGTVAPTEGLPAGDDDDF